MDQQIESMPTPQKKKSSVLKWILIGCGSLTLIGVIIIGAAVYFASRVMTMNPAKVEAVAQEILSFDKPQNFKGLLSLDTSAIKMAMFIGTDSANPGSMLILASGGSMDAMQQQMHQAMEQRGGGKMRVSEKLDDEKFQAQGKEVPAVVSLAQQGGDNTPRLLQYMMTLSGPRGNEVVLMIIGNEKIATHEWVQQFLDTVKPLPAEK